MANLEKMTEQYVDEGYKAKFKIVKTICAFVRR